MENEWDGYIKYVENEWGGVKSFFGMMFMIMNEGRLTVEHLYALAPAFLQFFRDA